MASTLLGLGGCHRRQLQLHHKTYLQLTKPYLTQPPDDHAQFLKHLLVGDSHTLPHHIKPTYPGHVPLQHPRPSGGKWKEPLDRINVIGPQRVSSTAASTSLLNTEPPHPRNYLALPPYLDTTPADARKHRRPFP